MTTLFLRKVQHINATDNYRVLYEDVEVGSIGIQWGSGGDIFWGWGIDTVLPPEGLTLHGRGENREDCMAQFKAAWHKFSRNPERLKEFLDIQRSLEKRWQRP